MAAQPGTGKLVATVGAACAAVLLACVPFFEGKREVAYHDVAGIPTVCYGSTKDVKFGKKYTTEECEKLLIDDLVEHAEGVKRCISKPMTTGQQAAFTSFAFNVGVNRFCSSTLAAKFNAGDAAGACAELKRWTKAGGKTQRGLEIRRGIEYNMCMENK